MDIIEYHSSKTRYLFTLVLSIFLIALGIFVIIDADELIVGLVVTGFFSLAVPICIKELLDTKPRLIIDDKGITDRTLGVGKILWSDIQAAELNMIRHNAFIGLKVDEPKVREYIKNQVWWKRFFIKANKVIGFQQLNINLVGLDADFDELLGQIQDRIE